MGCKHNWCFVDDIVSIRIRRARFICSECGCYKDVVKMGEVKE